MGKSGCWRSVNEELENLDKTLRTEKIKFNFLRNRINRLNQKREILEKAMLIASENKEDDNDVVCID